MSLKTSPFKNSVANVARTVGADSADEVKVVSAIPGSTMIILEDGTIIMGQLQPGKVRIQRGVKDEQGRQAYLVEWGQFVANVTPLPSR